jgi:hypothetical protein
VSEVIVIRTDHYDEALDGFITDDLLKAEREILVVADESRRRVDVPSRFHKVVAHPGRLGLLTTQDAMWRCGDYALYEAFHALPHASAFWLIEPDVRIHASDVKRFFDGLAGRPPTDFLTGKFGRSKPEWMWYPTMAPFAPHIHECMMQLCRISAAAAKHLYFQRLKLSAAFATGDVRAADWPNDEAFVMSLLAETRFTFARLADHAPDYTTSGTFSFTKPMSARWLQSLPKDNSLYHPVVSGDKFWRRIRAYLAERAEQASNADEILAEFESQFLPQVRLEFGDQRALVFRDEIRKVAAWVSLRHRPA